MPITFIQAISDALREEMERDASVFCIGEDIGVYGGAFGITAGLVDRFGPERVIDTPISESAIVGNAIGAALYGMRPVAEMQFADFVACGFNQLVNNAAKIHYRWGPNVPLTVRLPWGGGVSGGPFHSSCMEAWFFHVPGLKLVCPSTPTDGKGLLKAAIRDNNPVLYFEHKHMYRDPTIKEDVPEGDYVTPIGSARIARSGTDATVITYGIMVHHALKAAERLSASVEVIDLRSLRPFDQKTILESVKKTNRVLLVTEACLTGSITGEFSALVAGEAFEYLDAPVMRVGSLDVPIPYAPPLEKAMLPNPDSITAALEKLLAY